MRWLITLRRWIPQKVGVTIDSAMNGDADRDIKPNAEFKALYEADETVRDLIDKAKRLEGLPRHASVHASGVLISQNGCWRVCSGCSWSR